VTSYSRGVSIVALGFVLGGPAFVLPQESVAAPAAPALVVGAPRGQPFSGAALEARTEAVAGLLRCPVCQGLSVADSPATMAVNMKVQVREMLAAGYEQEQILAYFERSYGEFVRLQPPLRGVNWFVWLLPLAGLLAGGGVVAMTLRRASPNGATPDAAPLAEPAGRDALPDDPRLARAVLHVRELAYGWPGGLSPGSSSATSPPDPR
jgi:cytochrome c-type biogenesis protein CcmH